MAARKFSIVQERPSVKLRPANAKMSLWRVVRAAPGIALLVGLPIAALAGVAAGCVRSLAAPPPPVGVGEPDGGTVGGGGSDSGTTSVLNAPEPQNTGLFGQTCTAGQPTVDWSPMRRISRIEYDNMVRDLLGDLSQPAATFGFPPESPLIYGINFQANTYAEPSAVSVEDYLLAAESLAQSAVADTSSAGRLQNVIMQGIASCVSGGALSQTDTCATDFINSWANRAYRGQLDSTEASGLFSLYSTVKAQFDWPTGIQAIITAVLESPRFLYVLEFGSGTPTGKTIPLSPYELATRLALFLWRSVPDTILMTAAANGQLSTPAQIQAQATRMLAATIPTTIEPGGVLYAQGALDDFTNQWMELLTAIQAKDSQFANFDNNFGIIAPAMEDETRLDFSQAVLVENATLTSLLTGTSTYANQDLQAFYNATAASGAAQVTVNDPAVSHNTFTKTSVPNRPGILTTGAVMATQAHSTLPSFVLRGLLVRENLLCDPISPPPPGVPPPPATVPDGGTTRSLLLEHAQGSCLACHQYMDPIGVGFGNFDATGAYQSTDANGFSGTFPPIDASGTINPDTMVDTGGLQTTFMNVTDLLTKLAAAPQTQECFALQELRYALSRIETSADACSAQAILSAFTSNNLNVQSLMVAIATSDAFGNRSVEVAGSECQ